MVGRTDHCGSRSLRGTAVAALSHTLLESPELLAVDPQAYLRQATGAALRAPGTATLRSDLLA